MVCVGGGPAGLYFAILTKLRDPSCDISVFERDPAGSTYGWGVTYWGSLLDRLRESDPESARAIGEASVRWQDGKALVGGRTTTHRGDPGFGIGRHRLLGILADRAIALGVRVEFEREIAGEALDADLVVAADGVHSPLRGRHDFGTEVATGGNTYIWLGTTKVFDAFTFAFVETEHGWIWCYGYRFDDERSTCVIECAPTTWRGLGLDRTDEAASLELLEKLFADLLDGHRLIGRGQGVAQWLRFQTVTNRSWHHGNLVLLGDAAHTTHYSIGAGTTLAIEDAIALAGALERHPALEPALAAYTRERQAALLPIQSAARYSARFYEDVPRYLRLEPAQMFALLGQRHSPLLPHLPPRLYYRLDRAASRLEPLRKVKRWAGHRIAGSLQSLSR
ncbi:FAD-dependent monooxygenase [Nonomuraea soli]|uniref:2-polyprenyl-6-methoxyphenol hydroxylase-like FAD-dependent oxidoreductase n=1 Tax=Nonomuraea soli TaxID=1032476 RepID=A0A7W0CJF4_9ACTN|nr:FAD-dependent monooxygenase [Nonomuraea soli]MBA2892281.1 2-polyprenyl-6-methoxyphenol hydroxylase-like FAD-dependent oxidoreductase [Nonomuraea soli]